MALGDREWKIIGKLSGVSGKCWAGASISWLRLQELRNLL